MIVGLKEVARLKGHWLIQFSQRKYFEELMEEIQADSQAKLFMPGPTERNALENFHKSKERVFKIRDDHGEERR